MFGEADEDDPFAAKKKEKKGTEVTKLYGDWQTEEWIPPKAKNGKVPKNEHGNVLCPPLAFALPRVGGSHLVQSVRANINIIVASARSCVYPTQLSFLNTYHSCCCAAGDNAPEGRPAGGTYIQRAKIGLCSGHVESTGLQEM